MQQQLRFVVAALGLALAISVVAAEKEKEHEDKPQHVTLADLPAPARAAVEKWLAGGTIKGIEKEEEDGKVVYDIEATVKGKHAEADIAADGTVLTTEEEVAYNSLPKPVRDAAEKYFGSAKDLKASKEIEKGKAKYEVEGQKDNKKVTLKFDDTGKILEEEKE
jgi:uncharacterized membrane protein YkoI